MWYTNANANANIHSGCLSGSTFVKKCQTIIFTFAFTPIGPCIDALFAFTFAFAFAFAFAIRSTTVDLHSFPIYVA